MAEQAPKCPDCGHECERAADCYWFVPSASEEQWYCNIADCERSEPVLEQTTTRGELEDALDLPRGSIKIPTEVVTNAAGGQQSAVAYRMDLLPARATLEVAAVLHEGAKKYKPNNWRQIPLEDHINHALIHLMAHLSGDKQEPHLSHAACRTLMALEMSHATA